MENPQKTDTDTLSDSRQNELYKKLEEMAREKENLSKQLEMLKNEYKKSMSAAPSDPGNNKNSSVTVVRANSINKNINPASISPLSGTPNLVAGIVEDPDSKLVPNIIITIKDNKGMPLRAIKTNKLGQFETATPLPNGLYFLEIEDPLKRYTFDMIQITLSGKIFTPINIHAKGEREIMREKLAKELFGNATI